MSFLLTLVAQKLLLVQPLGQEPLGPLGAAVLVAHPAATFSELLVVGSLPLPAENLILEVLFQDGFIFVDLGRVVPLQVPQHNKRQGGPHGDAEGESRDQPRGLLAIHLLSPLTVRGRSTLRE
jgi:hypothetical protein